MAFGGEVQEEQVLLELARVCRQREVRACRWDPPERFEGVREDFGWERQVLVLESVEDQGCHPRKEAEGTEEVGRGRSV